MTNQLPPEIYRRRRIAALVVIVVVILAVLWGVSSLLSKDDTSAEQVNVTRDDGKKVTPSGKAAEPYKPSSEAKTKDEKSKDDKADAADPAAEQNAETAALAAKKDCSLADLQIKVNSDRPNYGAEQPKLALTIHNPTGGECVVNLDEQKLRFEVFTLGDYQRVWSDLDCNESEGQGELRLQPGADAVYTAVWSRLTSAPGKCTEADRQQTAPGPYLFYGLVGDNNSDGYTFNLG